MWQNHFNIDKDDVNWSPYTCNHTGARIDHGHHYNMARKALEETVALEEAVKSALRLVNLDDTLLIVTADHSHPLTIASYATRGNPILGECLYFDWYPDCSQWGPHPSPVGWYAGSGNSILDEYLLIDPLTADDTHPIP